MNKIKADFLGRLITSDDFNYITNDALEIFKSLGMSLNKTGDPMILWGMIATGNDVSAGAILGPDGEIYYHDAINYSSFNETTFKLDFYTSDEDSRTYYDGNDRYCHTTRRAILRVTTTGGWSGVTYQTANANRLDDKLNNLLNNKLKFETGDIYSTDVNGLQLQSIITTGNTWVNRYGGTLTIGEPGYTPTTKTYGDVQTINSTKVSEYNGAYLSGTITLAVKTYDRVVYGYSATSVSNDFDVTVSLDSQMVSRTGPYLGINIIVPAGSTCVFTLNSGTATSFFINSYKLGL